MRLFNSLTGWLRPLQCPFVAIATAALLASCQSAVNNDWKKRQPAPSAEYDSTRVAGASAPAMLDHRYFKSLVVEIQAVKGFAPTQETINRFQVFLQETLHMPKGVKVFVDESVAAGASAQWSVQALRALETKYRNRYPSKDEIAVHVFFLDGASQDDQPAYQTYGQSYFNLSIAIYSKTLRARSALAPEIPSYILETAILEHEFGHLLGLVAPGRADPNHAQHCNEKNCLMNYAIEVPGQPLREVPKLGAQCLSQLAEMTAVPTPPTDP